MGKVQIKYTIYIYTPILICPCVVVNIFSFQLPGKRLCFFLSKKKHVTASVCLFVCVPRLCFLLDLRPHPAKQFGIIVCSQVLAFSIHFNSGIFFDIGGAAPILLKFFLFLTSGERVKLSEVELLAKCSQSFVFFGGQLPRQ